MKCDYYTPARAPYPVSCEDEATFKIFLHGALVGRACATHADALATEWAEFESVTVAPISPPLPTYRPGG